MESVRVGSGYRSLIQEENKLGPHRFIWKSNWKANVSNKIKVFAWRICNNVLPSGCALNTRFQGMNVTAAKVGQPAGIVLRDLDGFVVGAAAIKLSNVANPTVTEAVKAIETTLDMQKL